MGQIWPAYYTGPCSVEVSLIYLELTLSSVTYHVRASFLASEPQFVHP